MKIAKIIAHIRLQTKIPNIKAFADVVLDFGEDGLLELSGFSIVQDQQHAARVVPPGNKGKRIYFDVVSTRGKIQRAITTAVLEKYESLLGRSSAKDGRQ
jgi:hypothetical protein